MLEQFNRNTTLGVLGGVTKTQNSHVSQIHFITVWPGSLLLAVQFRSSITLTSLKLTMDWSIHEDDQVHCTNLAYKGFANNDKETVCKNR